MLPEDGGGSCAKALADKSTVTAIRNKRYLTVDKHSPLVKAVRLTVLSSDDAVQLNLAPIALICKAFVLCHFGYLLESS